MAISFQSQIRHMPLLVVWLHSFDFPLATYYWSAYPLHCLSRRLKLRRTFVRVARIMKQADKIGESCSCNGQQLNTEQFWSSLANWIDFWLLLAYHMSDFWTKFVFKIINFLLHSSSFLLATGHRYGIRNEINSRLVASHFSRVFENFPPRKTFHTQTYVLFATVP